MQVDEHSLQMLYLGNEWGNDVRSHARNRLWFYVPGKDPLCLSRLRLLPSVGACATLGQGGVVRRVALNFFEPLLGLWTHSCGHGNHARDVSGAIGIESGGIRVRGSALRSSSGGC